MVAVTAVRGGKRGPMDRPDCIALSVHLGDEGAVEHLVRVYQDQLYGYALRLIGNSFDAEEVTQDTFIRACRTLGLRYGPDRCRRLNLRPWLYRIARNLALNRLRARRSRGEDPLPTGAELSDIPGPADREGSRYLETLADRDNLIRVLNRLESGSREVVVLRFFEGLSYAEIARITGGSTAAARGKVFRTLRRLHTLLNEGAH
jgi:RNA polymerase sigma-70 factor (ECF subfamily)